MQLSRHDALAKADEFERLAAAATSDVLRCRYQSFARYWWILAESGASAGADDQPERPARRRTEPIRSH